MEEKKITNSTVTPPVPTVINTPVVNIVTNAPPDALISATPHKTHPFLWIILCLCLALAIVSGVLLYNKITTTSNTESQPDLIVSVPDSVRVSVSSSPTPTLTDQAVFTSVEDFIFEDKPYSSEINHFQINIPQGWQINDTGESGSALVLFDPKTTIINNTAILTYINVSVSKESGETLSGYVEQARSGLKSAYKSFVIEDDRDLLRQGVAYHLISGSYEAESGVKMKNRSILLVYNNRGYAISATTPDTLWKSNELLLNATIFSFKNF